MLPNPEVRFRCLMYSKPVSESACLKERNLFYQKGGPMRRQGISPKSALPLLSLRKVYMQLLKYEDMWGVGGVGRARTRWTLIQELGETSEILHYWDIWALSGGLIALHVGFVSVRQTLLGSFPPWFQYLMLGRRKQGIRLVIVARL